MRRGRQLVLALPALAGAMLLARSSGAAVVVAAAGTPEHEGPAIGMGIHPGAQLEGHVGTGFSDVYNVGVGARLGFTTDAGIYLGGNLEHFIGSNTIGTPHNTLVAGELGIKLYPTYRLELRPYGLAGAEIPSNGGTSVAVAPGLVAAYHFGSAFVDVDGRYVVNPAPQTFMLIGGVGLGF
jgi:hypothetical protein